jgi:hypothetical protein
VRAVLGGGRRGLTAAAPFVGALAAWLALLWITSRPDASYVGEPLSPSAVAMRRLVASMRRLQAQMAEALLPVLEHAARAAAALNEAFERAERAAGVRE